MSANLPQKQTDSTGWKRPAVRWAAQWAVLFGLWLAFSGVFLREFLVLGALTAAIGVATFHYLFRDTHEGFFAAAPSNAGWLLATSARFLLYVPWLAWEIAVANLYVAYLVLHPRMPIEPMLVEFETSLATEQAQVLLAQSITLTPGTVTVDAAGGKLLVHCLSRKTRNGLATGRLQTKVGGLFGEPTPATVALTEIRHPGQVPQ